MTKLGEEFAPADKPLYGRYIFANTPSLKTVVLPEDLLSIGPNCFENSGVENIVLPETVRTICDAAFKNCDGITEVTFASKLIELGVEAFYDCDNLQKADLVYGVETLGANAFAFCEKLKQAYIPASVTSMSGNPFLGCFGLESYTLDPNNPSYVTDANGIIYDKAMYSIVYYPTSLTAATYEFPATVQEIAPGAFAGSQLKYIDIPTRITSIPAYAFQNSALETFTYHRGITSIGDHAFDGCKNLNNVTLMNTVQYAGHYAFANCTSLTNFVFEEKLAGMDPYIIGSHFFDGCTSLTNVILPNSMSLSDEEAAQLPHVTNRNAIIPGYMFANTGIVHAVIPARITDIYAPGVFAGCKQLESIIFEAETLNAYAIGVRFFYGCSKLTRIEIPVGVKKLANGITGVAEETFAECTALEEIIIHMSGVSSIDSGVRTFYNCKNLKTIMFLDGSSREIYFNTIRDGAFYGCESLKSIKMNGSTLYLYGRPFEGSGIEMINGNIYAGDAEHFAGMVNLKSIFIGSTKADKMTLDDYTFMNMTGEVNVYFYNLSRAQVVTQFGSAFMTNAGTNVHFFFKETMPDDVVIPT